MFRSSFPVRDRIFSLKGGAIREGHRTDPFPGRCMSIFFECMMLMLVNLVILTIGIQNGFVWTRLCLDLASECWKRRSIGSVRRC